MFEDQFLEHCHTIAFSHICNSAFPILILRCFYFFLRENWSSQHHILFPYALCPCSIFSVVTVGNLVLPLAEISPFFSSPLSYSKDIFGLLPLLLLVFSTKVQNSEIFPMQILSLKTLLTPLVVLVMLPTPISLTSFTAKWLRKLWMLIVSNFPPQILSVSCPISAEKLIMSGTSEISMLPNPVIKF